VKEATRKFSLAWVTAMAAAGATFWLPGSGDRAEAQTGPRAAEAIYARTCGYCHGTNVGPIIRGRKLPPEAIVYMVRHGQGAMPAFRPTEITDAELKALSNWISTSKADPKEHGQ
jgi:mono/diheme cytochrome c family protein